MKEHKLAAIVFTDIVGYTKRMEADEEGTMKLLARQREIIFPVVKEFGGEVIKEIGDGLLMMFTSANRAVRFAISVQEKLKDDELTIRAGIHIGDVIFEEGDVFGSAVNIAARIEPLAPAGGICISENVRSQIRNQRDILTQSIGKKELKGVDESLEIFAVVSELSATDIPRVPFFKDLWQRRVFQVIAIYLLMAYLLRLGTGYLVREYMLSPHLTNLIWYILLSLIPSITLVSYFHGRRGVSKWTKVELIGLPLNILAAFLVLFFVFKEKDLGAMTTMLTVQNEDGLEVEKVVAKSEFRKSIYLFNFETESKDSTMVYLQYSLPSVLEYDLSQDLFISPEPALGDFQEMVDAGYPSGVGLPVTLMKRLAEESHKDYFLTGDLDRQDEELILHARLYNTKFTKLVAEFTLRSGDPFSLVDMISVELKKGMGLPESHISETTDLPVAEIFTASEKALYLFSKAMRASLERNWSEHLSYLNAAIQEDPDFALAYVIITISYFQNGKYELSQQAVEKALSLQHKLSDRQKFTIKYVDYVLSHQPEKAIAVVKMWIELYPNDLSAYMTLAERYLVKDMIEEAIEVYKTVLYLDPGQYNMVRRIGGLYLQIDEFDSALVYYQKYADHLPQQAESYQLLGDYYMLAGEMDLAGENYERALLLANPNEKHSIMVDQALYMMHNGRMDEAYSALSNAMQSAINIQDSISSHSALEDYYLLKGQLQNSLEQYKLKMELNRRTQPPQYFSVQRIITIEPYITARKFDEAEAILEEIRENLNDKIKDMVNYGYLYIYAETGDTASLRIAINDAKNIIEAFGEDVLWGNIYYAEARISEHLEEYERAIDYYSRCLEMNAMSISFYRARARCYRKLEEYDKAEAEIQRALKSRPFSPLNNYEAALIYFDMQDNDKGLEHLKIAVDIWKDADPDYERASLAKQKYESFMQ
jgi:class 3 adenylate cyclase/tetratricopeptide (TPR) repeat protein